MMKYIVLGLVVLFLVSCGVPPQPQATGQQIVEKFRAAGLEAEQPRAMAKEDYGMAPFVCDGTRFLLPSLGGNAGGRVFVCQNADDLQRLKTYYDELGKASALFFSWTYARQPVLVQLNGDVPEAQARQYEQVVQQLP